jgi:hypothetical protein
MRSGSSSLKEVGLIGKALVGLKLLPLKVFMSHLFTLELRVLRVSHFLKHFNL